MQEEVNQKTVAFVVSTSKMTASILRQILSKYLQENQRKLASVKQNIQYKKEHAYKGKMSVKKLVNSGNGVSDIKIQDGNIRDFERIARKYGIEYALKRDNTVTPPQHIVFFRGRDVDVLNQAFKDYVAKQQIKNARPSIRMQLKRAKEILRKVPQKAKTKSRGQEL